MMPVGEDVEWAIKSMPQLRICLKVQSGETGITCKPAKETVLDKHIV